jgi:hypothetical protein
MSFVRRLSASGLLLGGALAAGVTPAGADATGISETTVQPSVTVASDVHAAIGDDTFLMTPSQRKAVGQDQVDRNQDVLSKATALIGVDGTRNYPTGFAGLVENPATNTLNVWWVGPMPAAVSSRVEETVPSVGLVVRPAPYSRDDLLAAIGANRREMTGVDLAFPKTDGTGIVVTHVPGSNVDAAAIARMTGVPVTVTEDAPAVDATGGRQADVAPHNGGAMMIHGNSICSTGFAVLDGIEGRLLSAAHCDPTGNWAWDNGAGGELTPGGAYVSVALSVDSMLINPDGGTSGYIYTGGFNSTTRAAVAGTDTNNEGETVATGGANSGDHLGLVIINDAYPGDCLGYACTLIVAEGDPGATVVVGGDSGGPVYHTLSDGRVNAKGIILQGAQQLAQSDCAPEKYPGNVCYNRVRYYPIRPLLNSVWNVSIETHS